MYHFDHSATFSEGSSLTNINILLERRLRALWCTSDRGIVSTGGDNDTALDNACDPVENSAREEDKAGKIYRE